MIHSTHNYIPWSSLSITSGDDYSSCESNMTSTPPTTPHYYKPISSSDLCSLDSPPLTPAQYTSSQQQHDHHYQLQQHPHYQGQQQHQQQYIEAQQLQLLKSIPPSINIQLSDYGLCLDTNITDIARLRNYLLSFVMDLPSPSSSASTPSTTQGSPMSSTSSTFSGQLVSRNKRYRNKPVNLFKRFYELGQLYINGVGGNTAIIPVFFQQLILRQQTVHACIHTYFDCWVRYFPVFPRQQVLAILDQPRGLDSVIVNAIACFVLKHMLAHHHYPPALESIRRDPAKIRDMEEFFFTTAKHTLEQLLFDDDHDDDNHRSNTSNNNNNNNNNNSKTAISRFDIMGMLLMSYKVDMKKKSIYMAMAVQSLQSLQIQPGDDIGETGDSDDCGGNTGSDTDSLWKAELDTRLWWMTWMNDFAVSSSGSSPNMPSASYSHHDDILKPSTISASLSPFSTSSSPSSSSIGENQQQQQQHQQQNRRRRVPRLWSFDCDGASEFGIMVNEHCLSIWRMQAEIIQHHYNSVTAETDGDRLHFSSDGSVVDFSLLDAFDTQLDRFLQQLPMELQSNLPYDATPISLVRARVHLELNATRIILHKLYIPDDIEDDGDLGTAAGGDGGDIDCAMLGMMDSSSLQWRSLNICLQSALDQVKIFHHCVMEYPSVLRCGFDRDELWRAAEIISVAVDFLAGVARRYDIKDQQHIEQEILRNIGTKDTLLQALHQSLMFVQNTYEVQQCNNSNFRQLEEWLKDRINYHNKPTPPVSRHHHHYQNVPQQNKPVHQSFDQPQPKEQYQTSSSSPSSAPSPQLSSILRQRPLTKKRKSSSSSSLSSSTSTTSSSSSFDQQISFATGPCVFTSTKPGVKHNNNAIFGSSSPPSQTPSKTRFRYFSPKQNRGLMFIDENPVNG